MDLRALILFGLLAVDAVPAGALPACVGLGDCDEGGVVTVDELVENVRIALALDAPESCPAFDCGDIAVSDCLTAAVRRALEQPVVGVNGVERIDVGGHRLRIRCIGSGSPTVLLEAGLGNTLEVWIAVQPVVAAFTRVCAYDRAGYGLSDPGPLPRTAAQIASELQALVGNGCLPAPYVLVAHSFGGLVIHLFASTYPQETAGLVFVDGRPAGFYDGLQNLQPPLPADVLDQYLNCGHPTLAAAAAECSSDPESEIEVASAPPLPQVPMTVFVSGQPDAGLDPQVAAEMDALWLALQTDLANSVPGAALTVVEECPHYIQFCRPDLIVGAIREAVDAFRAGDH